LNLEVHKNVAAPVALLVVQLCASTSMVA
jgi:hypothetical protein